MSLPPAFTGSAPRERKEQAERADEEGLLGEERGPTLQGWGQPAAHQRRVGVAHVVGGHDERARSLGRSSRPSTRTRAMARRPTRQTAAMKRG